jgi:alkylhydroperoxidase family enzyme
VLRRSSTAGCPRCARAHSAPYRPDVVRRSPAAVRPRCTCDRSARTTCRGMSLDYGCAPPLRLCPVPRTLRYVARPLLCALAAPVTAHAYHLPCYVARLRLCALAASKPDLRRPASLWCFALLLLGAISAPTASLRVPPAVLRRSSTAGCHRCARAHSAPYRPDVVRRSPAAVRPCCTRDRSARTTCRGMSLVYGCAPSLCLWPPWAVPPAVPRRSSTAGCPRCARAHSAPYRPDVVRRSPAAVRPRCTCDRSARTTCRGMSLVYGCAPSLRLCPVPPTLRYVARPLLCALAAPVASLGRTTYCATSLVYGCVPTLRPCPLCAVPLRCGPLLARCCASSLHR